MAGRNAVEDGDDRGFLSREECALAQGKKLRAAPLQQGGKRRSRPLLTKAIHEVGNERGSYQFGSRRFGKGWIFSFNRPADCRSGAIAAVFAGERRIVCRSLARTGM